MPVLLTALPGGCAHPIVDIAIEKMNNKMMQRFMYQSWFKVF
jgi:hypothetical protein